jgi:hypothetical protein
MLRFATASFVELGAFGRHQNCCWNDSMVIQYRWPPAVGRTAFRPSSRTSAGSDLAPLNTPRFCPCRARQQHLYCLFVSGCPECLRSFSNLLIRVGPTGAWCGRGKCHSKARRELSSITCQNGPFCRKRIFSQLPSPNGGATARTGF